MRITVADLRAAGACQPRVDLFIRLFGEGVAADMAARALTGVEKFLRDETLTSIPKPIDSKDYLVGHEQPPERLLKKGRDF